MKRKFLILTLCFTIIFSSINFKRSYADGGVISLPILATVCGLAVGSNIIINNNDDLYDLGNMFYDYVKNHNELTWDTVQLAFTSSVSVLPNKLISVKSGFLDIVNDFFDTFTGSKEGTLQSFYSIELDKYYTLPSAYFTTSKYNNILFCNSPGYFLSSSNIKTEFNKIIFEINKTDFTVRFYNGDTLVNSSSTLVNSGNPSSYKLSFLNNKYQFTLMNVYGNVRTSPTFYIYNDVIGSFPYSGGYNWDNVGNRVNGSEGNKEVSLPIPGDLSSLVGQTSDNFWTNTDNLVGNSDITVPNVNNPSISLDGTISFPNTNIDTDNPSIPDINNPSVDGIFPAFPSFGDSLDFSPMYLTNVTEKFPFSLPWDIGRLIQKFDVEPVAPVFEVPIVSETITLDLTEFSELASIVRFFVLIGFILALIFISTKLMA